MADNNSILITGAAGFIGSNLTKRLLHEGFSVTGVDNFSYGLRSNMNEFYDHPSFEFFERDITDTDSLKDLNADILIHLASYKIPRYSTAYPTLEFNLLMLKNVVKASVDKKMKLIYASTSDVYGKNPNVPFHENCDLVMGPTTVKRWAYATSKLYGEQYIIANHEEFGLNYCIVRFFGSYGPNQNLTWWGGPQSGFITNALKKLPIEIHGDGKQTRTFTYIHDTVDALVRCITNSAADKEIFNIGTEPDAEISILELANIIWRLINPDDKNALVNFIPYSTFGNYEDVMRRVPDITKIKNVLGYKPAFDLQSGLELTIDWQKKILNY
jgi:UDP-glucose 4-epimerase